MGAAEPGSRVGIAAVQEAAVDGAARLGAPQHAEEELSHLTLRVVEDVDEQAEELGGSQPGLRMTIGCPSSSLSHMVGALVSSACRSYCGQSMTEFR